MGGGNIAGQKQTKEEKRKEKCPAKEINRRNKIKKWNAAAARHLRSAVHLWPLHGFGQVAALYFSFDFPMNPPRLLLFNYFYRRSPLKMKTKTRDNFLRGDQEQEKSAGFIFGPYFYLLFHSASASFGPKNKGRHKYFCRNKGRRKRKIIGKNINSRGSLRSFTSGPLHFCRSQK